MHNEDSSPLTHAVIGAALEVHTELGPGFLEAVYHEAMLDELAVRNLPVDSEVELPIHYRGRLLRCGYRADLIVAREVLVELKAMATVGRLEEAQVIHYLKATHLPVGLLINFGAPSLQLRRLTNKTRRLEAPEISL